MHAGVKKETILKKSKNLLGKWEMLTMTQWVGKHILWCAVILQRVSPCIDNSGGFRLIKTRILMQMESWILALHFAAHQKTLIQWVGQPGRYLNRWNMSELFRFKDHNTSMVYINCNDRDNSEFFFVNVLL
jgi:hypothetical protein